MLFQSFFYTSYIISQSSFIKHSLLLPSISLHFTPLYSLPLSLILPSLHVPLSFLLHPSDIRSVSLPPFLSLSLPRSSSYSSLYDTFFQFPLVTLTFFSLVPHHPFSLTTLILMISSLAAQFFSSCYPLLKLFLFVSLPLLSPLSFQPSFISDSFLFFTSSFLFFAPPYSFTLHLAPFPPSPPRLLLLPLPCFLSLYLYSLSVASPSLPFHNPCKGPSPLNLRAGQWETSKDVTFTVDSAHFVTGHSLVNEKKKHKRR